MKKSILFFLLTLANACAISQSNPASATWPLTATSAKTVIVSGAVSAQEERLNRMEINKYTGPNQSQRIRMAGTNNTWPANQTAQLDTVYVEFSVAPKAGVTLNVSSVTFDMAGGSTSSVKANVYISTDTATTSFEKLSYSTGNANNVLPTEGLFAFRTSVDEDVADGKAFVLRIYPWVDNSATVPSGKYLCIQNVVISGTTAGEVAVFPPTLTTWPVTYVSTTTARCGGTVSADGGGPVTARGVCWNRTGSPTPSDSKTSDGSGTGSFASPITGLEGGLVYFIRAYATNSAGTAYGGEFSFTTLSVLSVPKVTTSEVSSIMVTTAACGGNVTEWGGSDVTARGVCWNETGSPTTADVKTADGSDIGSFGSYLTGLAQNTTYHVRAYATNGIGTGYGDVKTFTTQTPAPDVVKVVAKDGSGDYATVQAALDNVPLNYTGIWKVFIKKGLYAEKLVLAQNKLNVVMQGEDRDSTVLRYNDYQGKPTLPANADAASFLIHANDFTARDITFQNTSHDSGQAQAVKTNGDRVFFDNCRLLGYQDTYWGNGLGRVYFRKCYVEGTVDFIYGRSVMVFDNCTIRQLREGGVLTAASTESTKFGIVFLNCSIVADAVGYNGTPITQFYLGRPWHVAPQTVYINCEEPASVAPEGWTTMNVPPLLYAEYNCTGPGYKPASRVPWSRQLTDEEAKAYAVENIFAKSTGIGVSDWVPSLPTSVGNRSSNRVLPGSFALFQNYPNPFNPSTVIAYQIPAVGRVTLKIVDLFGRDMAILVDGVLRPGSYRSTFSVSDRKITSGVYFFRLQSGDLSLTKKMVYAK